MHISQSIGWSLAILFFRRFGRILHYFFYLISEFFHKFLHCTRSTAGDLSNFVAGLVNGELEHASAVTESGSQNHRLVIDWCFLLNHISLTLSLKPISRNPKLAVYRVANRYQLNGSVQMLLITANDVDSFCLQIERQWR